MSTQNNSEKLYLSALKKGETATICGIMEDAQDLGLRQHFLDMGIIRNAEITFVKAAPMGDPLEFTVHGYELTLRKDDAEKIEITDVRPAVSKERVSEKNLKKKTAHPGLGEGGKYHVKATEKPLPKGTTLTFALVGNQNCGKTTLFNQLTGSNQHVGNFPGVTVDRKDGVIRGHEDTLVTDLPGIYSMSPYTPEELVSRKFVLEEKPRGIINIIDATNIERNLYLTMQLLELEIPMVVALNMMDEVRENGGSINVNELESRLGVPVVPISAQKNEGIDELISHAIHVTKYQEKPGRQDFCDENDYNGAVHRAIHGAAALISDHAKEAGVPLRFAASKILEGDTAMINRLKLDEDEQDMLGHIVARMEKERGLDRQSAIADMRFSFILKVCHETVVKPHESKEHERSRKIDRVLTGKWTAIPAFFLIMGFIFFVTFGLLGPFLQNFLASGIDALKELISNLLLNWNVADWLHSLIIHGIFEGVGSVLSFLPVIVLLFFFLSMLEDSGYMARVAFVCDKLLRKIGLSGRSIVPLLIGFGCSVPAVMATRTLPSERDRKMTILLTPFMSCTAKLPIYSFFAMAFFEKYAWLVIIGVYLLDMLIGILIALAYRKTLFKGEAVPFVMELPNYRMPALKNVVHLLWEKAKDFLVRAFTVIFIASLVIWLLQSFNFRFELVSDSADSMLAKISGFIAPIFAPLGLNYWQIPTALIAGFMAKESVVSTLEILFGGNVAAILPAASALALLVFSSIYTPCVAAISSIRRELGWKAAVFVVIWQTFLAWILGFGAYLLAGLFM